MNFLTGKLMATGLVLAILSVVVLIGAGAGYRLGLWGYRTGFLLLLAAIVAGIAALGFAATGIYTGLRDHGGLRQLAINSLVLVLAAPGVILPSFWLWKAFTVPSIHDITTDTQNPPQFTAIKLLRTDAVNSTDYGGPEVAAQQQQAYPDIVPRTLPAPPAQVFSQAQATAQDMGWKIVVADATTHRIEATDTTRWFGFKDDIVIRITAQDGGSRIDVRSLSRVGRSDLGANARRIRAFLDKSYGPIEHAAERGR